jgi:hypothetical protein
MRKEDLATMYMYTIGTITIFCRQMSFPHYKILIAMKLNIIYKHLLSYTAKTKKNGLGPIQIPNDKRQTQRQMINFIVCRSFKFFVVYHLLFRLSLRFSLGCVVHSNYICRPPEINDTFQRQILTQRQIIIEPLNHRHYRN